MQSWIEVLLQDEPQIYYLMDVISKSYIDSLNYLPKQQKNILDTLISNILDDNSDYILFCNNIILKTSIESNLCSTLLVENELSKILNYLNIKIYTKGANDKTIILYNIKTDSYGNASITFLEVIQSGLLCGLYKINFNEQLNTIRKSVELEVSKFQIISDNSPGLTKISNFNNYYYYFNKKWLDFTEIDEVETLSNTWFDYIYEEDKVASIKLINDHFKKRIKYVANYRMVDSKANIKYFVDYSEPYFDNFGFFMGYVSSAIDVTDEVLYNSLKSENEIRNSILYDIKVSMDNSQIPIVGIDKNDLIVYVNDKAELALDLTKELQVDFKFYFNYSDEKTSLYHFMKTYLTSKIVRRKININAIRNDSKLYTISLLNQGVDLKGEIVYLSCQNVSEINIRKNDSIFQESRFLDILDSMQDLYFKINRKFQIVEVNAVIESMLGYNRNQLLGSSIDSILIEIPRKIRKSVFNRYSNFTITLKVLDVYQNIHSLECKIRIVFDPILEQTCFIGVAKDITRLLDYQSKLELQNKKIKRLMKVKDEFLANMSHEIRTPLNGIVGITELLASHELPNDIKEYISALEVSSNILLTTVNDILDFSKIEAGKYEIIAETIRVSKIVEYLNVNFGDLFKSKSLKFNILISDIDIDMIIKVDNTRLLQILNNLIMNAYKFTDSGFVYIKIEIYMNILHILIVDSGPGVSGELIAKLFQPFTQLNSTTTKRAQGTGLGLYISHRLSKLMGGTINYKHNDPVGSIFELNIPIQVVQSETTLTHNTSTQLLSHKILLVDDNQINCKVAKALLQSLHQTVVVATSFHETVHILQMDSFDIIFMDIQMPDFDGIYTRNYIVDNKLSTARIIAVTAYSMSGDESRFLDAGFDGYISKPLTKQKLIDSLTNFALHTQELIQPDLINLETLNTLQNILGKQSLLETIHEYRTESFELLDTLLVDQTNYENIFHTIKGTSSTIGMTKVSQLAQENELRASLLNADDLVSVLKQMQKVVTLSVTFAIEHINQSQ